MGDFDVAGGTGNKLTRATTIVAGVAALVATLLSVVSIWLQTKNYRKPLLQRYVVRILLMVPIYAISSWSSLISIQTASFVEPIRDIYEAFTIYTFFQLLINFIDGERALIIMMHGREPVSHLWPLDTFLEKVDISDPHTFLAIKRGILQYAWLKPLLALATIVMKATGVYQEGYIGLTSGYFWSGLIYNISVTLSLYSLGMFWVCMSKDLEPFRPVPKFLCVKLIIFASYWQGFLLSILVWLGALPDNVTGYTPDNLAAAIQDALICCEMPIFAMAHWYAFSWHDYADDTISSARMPVWYAVRDAFGIRDLIEDTKETFTGESYDYRFFDSGDNVMAHAESSSRVKRIRDGMRYERGGRGKYWIPRPGQPDDRTPLLGGDGSNDAQSSSDSGGYKQYSFGPIEEAELDGEEENLYDQARKMRFGDWNYKVITVNQPPRQPWLAEPQVLTTATHRTLIHRSDSTNGPAKSVEETVKKLSKKGKRRASRREGEEGRAPTLQGQLDPQPESPSSARDQLVDLVVEDEVEERRERVRARKEGSAGWNEVEPKRFVRTYPENRMGEEVREGFEPAEESAPTGSNVGKFAIDEDEDEDSEESRQWQEETTVSLKPKYGLPGEALEENVWDTEPAQPPRENP